MSLHKSEFISISVGMDRFITAVLPFRWSVPNIFRAQI